MPNPSIPNVGMGATICYVSDRRACTVVWHSTSHRHGMPLRVVVQRDTATRTDKLGMSDAQEYSYARNYMGEKREFTLRRDGTYIAKGETMKRGTRLCVGVRDEHFDFSF